MTMSEFESIAEAFDTLNEHPETFVVEALTNDGTHFIGRDKYGSLVLDTWVPVLATRRQLRITEGEAEAIMGRAHLRDGPTLKMHTHEQAPIKRIHDDD